MSYAKECKYFVKKNIFVIFDKIHWQYGRGEDRLVVYIYDGDYLTCEFRRELINLSNGFEDKTCVVRHNNCNENSQTHSLRVYRVNKSFSIIGTLHDPKHKFNYVSMVGGVVVNRQIERIDSKKKYKDTSYSLFAFFMAMFCQSFKNEFRFNQHFVQQMEIVKDVGQVTYDLRFDVCANGHVCCTLGYDSLSTDNSENNLQHFGEKIEDVYKSPIVDISVDVRKETNGHFPGVKRTYSEHVVYDKYLNGPQYEDRGIKHLYEHHHHCCFEESSSPSSSGYCNSFCKMK